MGDALGKVFAAIFGCIIMFIVPIMLIAQKQEVVVQNYIDNAVVEFVDNARTTAVITDDAYEDLCNAIDTSKVICDVRIIHSSSYTVPKRNAANPDIIEGVMTYRQDFNKEEILDKIYTPAGDNEVYRMKNGDYLKVEVKNITPTLATRMVQMFFTRKDDASIYVSYGGFVGNNKQ